MNCQDIKDQLLKKDNEIAERKKKTYEYFDLVKDDVINYLIMEHINDEFKGGYHPVPEGSVMKILYKKLGVDTKFMKWHYMSTIYFKSWTINNYRANPDLLTTTNEDDFLKFREVIDKSIEINDGFDFEFFGSLLMKHIKSKGFEQEVIKSKITGDKYYYFCFGISRDKIENGCCDDGGSADFKEVVEDASAIEVDHHASRMVFGIIGIILASLIIFYAI